MKNTLFKLLPFVVGGFLGWLLFASPDWFTELGPARYLVGIAGVAVLLVSFVAVQILASLPADVSLVPATAPLDAKVQELVDQYRAVGFAQAGPAYTVGVTPPALLVPLVHEEARCYGTVFRTGTLPAKLSYDVVSILEGDRGGLTTGPDAAGGTLPAGTGSLRQFFPRASVAELFERHREAQSWLAAQGLASKRASAATFAADFRMALARQRRDFLAAPVRTTVGALWRAATKMVPNLAPLAQQPEAQQKVKELVSGVRG